MKNMRWNLGLLYKSEKDPQIEKDVRAIENEYIKFEKKYRGKDFTSTAKKLFPALQDAEALDEKTIPKPWWYFALRTELNSDDSVANAASTKIMQRLQKASNRVKFFSLVIGKIPSAKQKEYLNSPLLKKYRYYLEQMFIHARYQLSEAEEQLVSLLSQTSYTMWVDGQQKMLTQKTIEYKGEEMPLGKVIKTINDLPKNERRELNDKLNSLLKENSQFAESEINATYNYKKIMDEKRGYKKPYSATVISYENDEKTVEELVSTVTKYFKLSHRFFKIHAKILGEKKLTMADRNVKVGTIKKKFDFETTVDIVSAAFKSVDNRYKNYLDSYLKNKQIDVMPAKGKNSGAFCWGMGQLPTFVLLNHTENIDSVETLAHEMGHAIHTELSKSQPAIYLHYSTACAEVASTFFEQLVSDELSKQLTEYEQLILLHSKIQRNIQTVFRQIACFNFENELHLEIRKNGELSRDKIAQLMQKHLQSYVGEAMDVTEDDGYFFVYWSHIRRYFYVYSYAYGQLISRVLYEKWKENPKYEEKIRQFLSAGRSMSPKDIFKSVGINTNAKFFEAGLKAIEKDIDQLERLAKKTKKI